MSANPHNLGEPVSRADKVAELKTSINEKRLRLERGFDDSPLRRRMEVIEAILVDYLHGDQRQN